jgi:hypothetical protein
MELRGPILRISKPNDTVGQQIERLLKGAFSEPIHCPRCGRLLPDLVFVVGNTKYSFVCRKVTHRDLGVIAETDYKKLGEYCQTLKKKE